MKKKTKVTLAIVAVLLVGGYLALLSYMRLSMEEIQEYLEPQMEHQLSYFESEYDCEGELSYEVDYSELEIMWEPLYWDQGVFNTRGRIIGELTVVVDAPVAYPYLEKESYDIYDVKALHLMACTVAHDGHWSDPEPYDNFKVPHYAFCPAIDPSDAEFLDSQGNQYKVYYWEDWCALLKNGDTVFEWKLPVGACTSCAGTGGVRYNYGGSDLEAVLSGNDPYTYGQCGSCGGTGRAR